MTENTRKTAGKETTLVIGGSGKTGRRVAERLAARGLPVRAVSRSSDPQFDWNDETTWAPALRDVRSVYVTYYPDLAFPGAADTIAAFTAMAVGAGVRRFVLLSGRGEEGALVSENALREAAEAGAAGWTVLRCSWFAQNFSEDFLLQPVLSGEIALPAADVAEPFVDVDDVADAAVAALTEDGHAGQVYEMTGPRALTFAEVAAEITKACGREVRYRPVSPERFRSALAEVGLPPEYVEGLTELFARILDGRNTPLTDGVQRALGRSPRDFADYAAGAAATSIWTADAHRNGV